MDRSEANEKAKQYISNAGFGTGTNITTHALKCLMVDFYLDNQVKNLDIPDVSQRSELFFAVLKWAKQADLNYPDEMLQKDFEQFAAKNCG